MRNRISLWLLVALILICCASSGCDLTLGPKTKTEYVVVHPGVPLQILENTTVRGRTLEGEGSTVQLDVGGWVAMPLDHWLVVKKTLEAKK